ncbi:hypothetical protein [Sphingomonas sp. Root241]|uniref:hypothetical protein n=1 Tax=Sphingomonas sp. Root241 TaxID=1736501 RepID=UPI0012E340BC|nr:hypothetical protein [Sphingomonas sp. Root241]
MSFDEDESRREAREHAREKRRRRHLERLGFENAQCIFCGEDDKVCLHLDHVDGQEFSDVVWPLCANCHAKRTHLQKDHPPKDAEPSDPLEKMGRMVEGLADYLEITVTRLREFGPILCAEAAARSPRKKRDGGKDERTAPPQ